MCGIVFSLQRDENDQTCHIASQVAGVFRSLQVANACRGPDAQEVIPVSLGALRLTYFASELRLRGDTNVTQPHRDEEGNILCWNGEIFEGLDVSPHENDGANLFALLRCLKTPEEICELLGSFEGPYALVYYHSSLKRLFFTRDPLGRRSLLIHKPDIKRPYLLLSSVSVGPQAEYTFEELSTDYIFSIDLERLNASPNVVSDFSDCMELLPRRNASSSTLYAQLSPVNRELPHDPPLVKSLDHIPPHLTAAVDGLIEHLDRSVMLRVRNIPRGPTTEGQARVAILFSGGIDSTMLAFLAHRHVDQDEPIDLLNVAFENPRKIRVRAEGNIGAMPKRERRQKVLEPTDYSTFDVSYNVPDRLTGRQEVEELKRLCPGRIWNFVEVNVPYDEYLGALPTVEALMFPGRTVMDLSLAVALYFAARGIGQIQSKPDDEPQPYKTPARVLLNGLGSDELLGGYGRFRVAYKHGGWQAIIDELQLELDRIPTRNLGRDDRVISSHGKETRHPFLSLSLVAFLGQLPVHMKTDPRLESGLGEKMLLRLAARKLGLVEASSRKKRAMQFGSHSARMEPGERDKHGEILIG